MFISSRAVIHNLFDGIRGFSFDEYDQRGDLLSFSFQPAELLRDD